ncbi:MAG: TIGR03885 family FMN-dependent LLM class oxidoreductase [Gemmobacter sp.]|uniref:TIGR03885 family FMN-dependent LLM class oxidoreductase n=1 Tax=Gemmobacter sp. TaxID=1898957 RepID=UPI001A3BB483|nr:TIGR03885 family FMN-dependent LLM class oxidoreductase [Gemmobacter sp.]MBL8562076.1 TIGR03885 family FMN-dependent LLM class oxidoreductase [Gemmobacter sp.]
MVMIGYHASHEQFAPSELLRLCRKAQEAGFDCLKSSDHFHPWSERQGQSGFAWAWAGAVLEATPPLSLGMISAPGYRYHPAVLAQAAATLAEMYEGRLWLALGSGEALNEAITGLPWPDKAERNARLAECAEVMRALFRGEEVTHRGRVTVIGARLYSRPAVPLPLYAAAISPETAAEVAGWADGLLTVGGDVEKVARVVTAFRENGGAGKPVHIQHALSWADTYETALAEAADQWAPVMIGGAVNQMLSRPQDFDLAANQLRDEDLCRDLAISADLDQHAAWIADLLGLEATLHLHCVGRNQEAFIEAFGARVLPQLR